MYYFPTSTLNFSSIISSQRILPPQCYVTDSLWWNRYEKTVSERDSVSVLYNRFPVWSINDPDRDNYPLVIAIENSLLPSKKSRSDLKCKTSGRLLSIVLTAEPIELQPVDIFAGRIVFFFRSEEEKTRILQKAECGADECKVLTKLMATCSTAFQVAGRIKNAVALPLVDSLLLQIDNSASTVKTDINRLIKDERERGATLGYKLGGYVRSLRDGNFGDAFRQDLDFKSWRDDVLPKWSDAILEKFLARPALAWDPNRSAVMELVDNVKQDLFCDKLIDQNIKEGLAAIYSHWGSAERGFKISEIENPYLQGFAAFLECGAIAGKYPRYLKSQKLKSPEYMLSLYGALVGYTAFSRTLLSNDNYLPENPHHDSERLKDSPQRQEPMEKPAQQQPPPAQQQEKKAQRMSQPELDLESPARKPLVQDTSLLVCDNSLPDSLVARFAEEFGQDRVKRLKGVIEKFSDRYLHGYYGQEPGSYAQSNPALIDHLFRCFSSSRTEDLNFKFENKEEQKRLQEFFETRYKCVRAQ